jgi:hypothetical protein
LPDNKDRDENIQLRAALKRMERRVRMQAIVMHYYGIEIDFTTPNK